MSRLTASWLPLLCICLPAFGGTWYVDRDNTSGVRDGKSWATAFTTVQPAIDAAFSAGGGDVWVAEGVYGEERTSLMHFPRVNTASIVLKPRVYLYGGFAGTETLLTQRDSAVHETILDGSRSRGGLPAYHVVTGSSNSTLDGFTIRGGRSGAVPASQSSYIGTGAGLYLNGVTMPVVNCAFTENTAGSTGGGVYALGGIVTLTDCRFKRNSALAGGGVYATGGTVNFEDCRFDANEAASAGAGIAGDNAILTATSCMFTENVSQGFGGGLNASAGSAAISDCVFVRNTGAGNGGGLSFRQTESSTIGDCSFVGNGAAGGGAVYIEASPVQVEACSFFLNTAGAGGALRLRLCSSPDIPATPVNAVTNCMFWHNAAAQRGGAIASESSRLDLVNCSLAENLISEEEVIAGGALHVQGQNTQQSLAARNCVFGLSAPIQFSADNGMLGLTYCVVPGGYDGTGNVNAEPEFAAGAAGDLRLLAGSAGVNAGTAIGAAAVDYFGVARPQGGGVDMGAFERIALADADGDGIPDAYEAAGDTDDDGTPDTLDTDSDDDGLGDSEEGLTDVDGDGLPNCADVDSDGDGLEDGVESALEMSPYLPDDATSDPDEDGLTTAEEVELGTMPFESDTDGDEIPDGWEAEYELDPLSAEDATADADSDGISNLDEFRVETDPTDETDPPRDVYVSTLGNDSTGDGTLEKPWRTIAWAHSIYCAGRYYKVQDVTVHLGQGTFAEPVNLLPGAALVGDSPLTTTLQFYGAADEEHVVVTGADGASLRNLRVRAAGVPDADVTLVKIEDAAVEVANVVLDGNFSAFVEGVYVGADTQGTVVRDSVLRRLQTGIRAVDSDAVIARNTFDSILGDAVVIRAPEPVEEPDPEEPVAKEGLRVPNLGTAALVDTTGLNRFRNIAGLMVANETDVPVMAENIDWGVYTEGAVLAKASGPVDALPYMGTALSPGAVAVRLRVESTGDPVDPAEQPRVALAWPELSAVQDGTSGLWVMSNIPAGERILAATANGYAVGVRMLDLTADSIVGLDLGLVVEDTVDPANVDRLGGINVLDLQLAISQALGTPVPFVDADVDDNGRVDARDIQLLLLAVLSSEG